MRALTSFLTFFMICLPLLAQWDEIPQNGTMVDVGGTANKTAQAVTTKVLHATDQYWIGARYSQISSEGNILSQDLDARMQGSVPFKYASVQGFVQIERDMHASFASQVGIYARKDFGIVNVSVGNFIEREQLRDTQDIEILPYWLFGISASHQLADTVHLHGKSQITPQGNFAKWRGDIVINADVRLDTNLTLKLQSAHQFKHDIQTENAVILSVNF